MNISRQILIFVFQFHKTNSFIPSNRLPYYAASTTTRRTTITSSLNSYSHPRHDYIRDPRDLHNNLSNKEEVDVLLGERVTCKKRRLFDEADDIRDVLKDEYGVYVDDRSLTYFTDSSLASFGGGRNDRNGSNSSNRGRSDSRDSRGDRRGGGGRNNRDFGPKGHDYSKVSDNAGVMMTDLTENDIDELLAKRLQAKLSRDFRVADEIQEHLFQNNVAVHDGQKLWRADGMTFGDGGEFRAKPGMERGSRADRNRPYTMSELSESVNDEDKSMIEEMIEERVRAKQDRDYDVADDIRDTLLRDFDVRVEDRLREWSVGGMFPDRQAGEARRVEPYAQAVTSENIDDDVKVIVEQLVQERSDAKGIRDFVTADAIRDRLTNEFNVVVDDREKLWSVGGDFGRLDRNRPFTMSALSEPVNDEDKAMIEEMIEQRVTAKKDRDFDVADDIRDTLVHEFGVKVEDRLREWSVGGMFSESKRVEPYAQAANSDEIHNDDKVIVEQLVQERSAAKKTRDFRTADAIRDRLNNEFNVAVDDKERLWSVGGDFGFGKRLTRETYEYAGEKSSLTISDKALSMIEDLLKRRSAAKKVRDYDEADAIRDKLRDLAKIEIDDRNRVWFFENSSVDENESDDGDDEKLSYASEEDDISYTKLTDVAPDFISNLESYKKADDTPTFDDEDYVTNRLKDMLDAEKQGDYSTAVAIRTELKLSYNVEINDKQGEWYVTSANDNEAEPKSTIDTSNSPEEHDMNEENLSKLTIPSLKEKLRNAGLPVSGKKAELIERLMNESTN